jgi:hypothetical protein
LRHDRVTEQQGVIRQGFHRQLDILEFYRADTARMAAQRE